MKFNIIFVIAIALSIFSVNKMWIPLNVFSAGVLSYIFFDGYRNGNSSRTELRYGYIFACILNVGAFVHIPLLVAVSICMLIVVRRRAMMAMRLKSPPPLK